MRLMLVKGVGLVGLGQAATATPTQVQAMIASAAAGYGSVPNLDSVALGVASHESRFVSTAQNPGSSAAGVFQLVSSAQQYTGVTNPLDAQQNVNAGVGLLAQYYNTYGNWPQAIQAFSDGPGTVQQGLPPSAQTLDLMQYVQSSYGVDVSGDDGVDAVSNDGIASTADSGLSLSLSNADGSVNWTTVGLLAAGAALAVSLV